MPKIKSEIYEVSFSFDGRNEITKGETIKECFEKLDSGFIKSKCLLSVKKGDQNTERMLSPYQFKRLVVSETMRIILEKQLNQLLK